MPPQKGQITGFIIIIVLLLIAFIIITRTIPKVDRQPEILTKFDSGLDLCSRNLALDIIDYMGLQGGYYDPPSEFINDLYAQVPIFFDKGEIIQIPTRDEFGEQLKKALKENFYVCEEKILKKEQIVDLPLAPEISVVTGESIFLKINYPVKIGTGSKVEVLSPISLEIPFNYLFLREKAETILKENIKNPSQIPVGRMGLFSYFDKIEYEVVHVKDNDYIYRLGLSNYSPGLEQYTFSFGVRLDEY